MADRIRITTEKLREKMQSLEEIATLAGRDFRQSCEEGITIAECFDGEAVKYYVKAFAGREESGESTFNRLVMQIRKLDEIATIYEKAEGENRIDKSEN